MIWDLNEKERAASNAMIALLQSYETSKEGTVALAHVVHQALHERDGGTPLFDLFGFSEYSAYLAMQCAAKQKGEETTEADGVYVADAKAAPEGYA